MKSSGLKSLFGAIGKAAPWVLLVGFGVGAVVFSLHMETKAEQDRAQATFQALSQHKPVSADSLVRAMQYRNQHHLDQGRDTGVVCAFTGTATTADSAHFTFNAFDERLHYGKPARSDWDMAWVVQALATEQSQAHYLYQWQITHCAKPGMRLLPVPAARRGDITVSMSKATTMEKPFRFAIVDAIRNARAHSTPDGAEVKP